MFTDEGTSCLFDIQVCAYVKRFQAELPEANGAEASTEDHGLWLHSGVEHCRLIHSFITV